MARILPHRVGQEARRALTLRFGLRHSGRRGGNDGGLVIRRAADCAAFIRPNLGPRAFVEQLAVRLLPALGALACVDQRIHRARVNRNFRPSRDLQHPQRMADFLVTPTIAAGHRDAQDLDILGLQHHQDCLEVGGCGTESVLVDDDFAASVRGMHANRRDQHQKQRQGCPNSCHGDDSNSASAQATVTVAPRRSRNRRHSSAACPFASPSVRGPAP